MLFAGWLAAAQLPVRVYSHADGMARDDALCAVRDHRGFLWLCTAGGLSRFDGYRFVNFGTAQGLAHRSVLAALETRAGVLLAATAQGLSRMDEEAPDGSAHKFVTIPYAATGGRAIFSLLEDHSGTVWAGTYGGVFRLRQPARPDSKLEFVPIGDGLEPGVGALALDQADNLWMGTGAGLIKRRPDGGIEHPDLPHARILSLCIDHRRTLWAGTLHGLWQVSVAGSVPRVERIFQERDGLASERIHAIYESPNGTLWAGTAALLSELAPGGDRFHSLSAAEGLSGRTVTAILEDRDGNLWVATDQGLARIARDGFQRFSALEGVGGIGISSLLESSSGRLFAVSNELNGPRILEFHADVFHAVRPRYLRGLKYSGWGWSQTALLDKNNSWWVATGAGLYRFAGGAGGDTLAGAAPEVLLPDRDIFRVFEDSRGDVWISTSERLLARWQRADGRLISYPVGLLPGAVSAFAEDAAGNVWMGLSNEPGTGMQSELVRYHDGEFQPVRADCLADGWISALLLDSRQRLWIASTGHGLAMVEQPAAASPRIQPLPPNLAGAGARCLAEDGGGRIYAAGPQGLDRVDLAAAQMKHYSTEQGYPSGACGALRFDRQGALWVGTSLGLALLPPQVERPDASPAIYLTDIMVNGEPQTLHGNRPEAMRQFGPGPNRVRIEFVSTDALGGRFLRYRYFLEGADRVWSAAAPERVVQYANLAPGRYHFRVRSVTESGMESEAPAEFSFELLPPLWQRAWFLAMLCVLLAGLGWTIHRRQLARQLELERVRTRIAADLHDDLGASLSRVAILSETLQLPGARPAGEIERRLGEIAETAREVVDSLSDVVWAVNPRHDEVRSLLSRTRQVASELLEPQGIVWTLEAAPSLENLVIAADLRRHLFLIVKEALTNAARHAGCRTVDIGFDREGALCRLWIRDDGRGMAPDRPVDGNGLRNMAERAAMIGGRFVAKSKQGKGTEICVEFPLT
jgi:signal transduction histidine kinase/ligand-binding sensor domain-containing protein